jgi:mRNA-degrading endonuclease toxin of MazEF toxin-antitoxin module
VPRTCIINCDSLNTIPKSALNRLICTLSPAKMAEVKAAIVEALDLR